MSEALVEDEDVGVWEARPMHLYDMLHRSPIFQSYPDLSECFHCSEERAQSVTCDKHHMYGQSPSRFPVLRNHRHHCLQFERRASHAPESCASVDKCKDSLNVFGDDRETIVSYVKLVCPLHSPENKSVHHSAIQNDALLSAHIRG